MYHIILRYHGTPDYHQFYDAAGFDVSAYILAIVTQGLGIEVEYIDNTERRTQ